MPKLTPTHIWRHFCWRVRLLWLRIVYVFSPAQFWNLRSREINDSWFDDDADYQIMRRVISSTKSRSCLEVGCNGGRFSRFLVNDLDHLTCQDISGTAVELCRKAIPAQMHLKIRFDEGFIDQLYARVENGRFDLMISNRVLSALKPSEIRATLAILARISKSLLINELLPGEPGATYYWFAHDYDLLLAGLGFERVQEIESNSAPFVQKFRVYQSRGV